MKFFTWVASLFSSAQQPQSQKEEKQEATQETKSGEPKWRDDLHKVMALTALIKHGQMPADDCSTALLIKVYMSTNAIYDQDVEIAVIRLLKARPDCTARQLLKLKGCTPVMSLEVHAAIDDALNTNTRTKELKEMISEE